MATTIHTCKHTPMIEKATISPSTKNLVRRTPFPFVAPDRCCLRCSVSSARRRFKGEGVDGVSCFASSSASHDETALGGVVGTGAARRFGGMVAGKGATNWVVIQLVPL